MFEYFRSAIHSLISNKLRSALTILGIIIGVWAIVSMQSIVTGFQYSMREMMSQYGTETFFIRKFPVFMMGHDDWRKYSKRKDITYHDAIYLDKNAQYLRSAAAFISNRAQRIKYRDKKTSPSVLVTGATAGYFTSNATTLNSGRFFSQDDVHHLRNVAVVGMDVVDELFSVEDPIGKTIKVKNTKFRIIGVLNPMPGIGDESPDNVVIIPIRTFQKIYEWSSDSMELILRATSSELLVEAMDEVISLMRVLRKVPAGESNDFEIFTGDSILKTLNNFTIYIQVAALGIAGISLIVAGIGIMNIMLVAVLERTKEIGTRKAVGAKKRDILFQFLIESIILSEFGAVLGLVLGFATAAIFSKLIPNMTAIVPIWAISSAISYCSIIGISFGSFPAYKASKMDPIEALHYE